MSINSQTKLLLHMQSNNQVRNITARRGKMEYLRTQGRKFKLWLGNLLKYFCNIIFINFIVFNFLNNYFSTLIVYLLYKLMIFIHGLFVALHGKFKENFIKQIWYGKCNNQFDNLSLDINRLISSNFNCMIFFIKNKRDI